MRFNILLNAYLLLKVTLFINTKKITTLKQFEYIVVAAMAYLYKPDDKTFISI